MGLSDPLLGRAPANPTLHLSPLSEPKRTEAPESDTPSLGTAPPASSAERSVGLLDCTDDLLRRIATQAGVIGAVGLMATNRQCRDALKLPAENRRSVDAPPTPSLGPADLAIWRDMHGPAVPHRVSYGAMQWHLLALQKETKEELLLPSYWSTLTPEEQTAPTLQGTMLDDAVRLAEWYFGSREEGYQQDALVLFGHLRTALQTAEAQKGLVHALVHEDRLVEAQYFSDKPLHLMPQAYAQLGEAWQHGTTAVFALMRQSAVNVNAQLGSGTTALHNAAARGEIELVTELLACGADLDTRNRSGITPLREALRARNWEVAALLLPGSSADTVNACRCELFEATIESTPPTVEWLCSQLPRNMLQSLLSAADEGTRRNLLITALKSVSPGHRQHAALLLELLGTMPQSKRSQSDLVSTLSCRDLLIEAEYFATTPLPQMPQAYARLADAWQRGTSAVFELMRQSAVNVNVESRSGNTTLHIAATSGDVEVVRELLISGADLAARNCNGNTPLHEALRAGHTEVAALVKQGNALDGVNNAGETLLHAATNAPNPQAIKWLCSQPSPEVRAEVVQFWLSKGDRYGNTPLHAVFKAEGNQCEKACALLSLGADINARNSGGEPPLGMHVGFDGSDGNTALLTLALEPRWRLDLNAIDKQFDTLLHTMVAHGDENTEIVQLLLKHNRKLRDADVFRVNGNGKSPLDLLNRSPNPKLRAAFRASGRWNQRPPHLTEEAYRSLMSTLEPAHPEPPVRKQGPAPYSVGLNGLWRTTYPR